MKLTKEALKRIIKEELEAVMDEGLPKDYVAGVPSTDYSPPPQYRLYEFTPEQKEAMRRIIKKLNNMRVSYDTMASALRFLKYRHPAFKGFEGEPLDIQNGLKSLGYKGYTVSTTAIP